MQVPQLWSKAGIADPRQFPIDPSAKPFGSVVVIVTVFADTKTGKSQISLCSGFLIEDRRTVGTAGHCYSKGPKAGFVKGHIYVGLAGADGALTWVAAKLTAWANGNSFLNRTFNGVEGAVGQDWAVLRLDELASEAHEPLRLPTPGSWTAAAAIDVAEVGYGVDLDRVVLHSFPKPNPSPAGLMAQLKRDMSASDTFMASVQRMFTQPPAGLEFVLSQHLRGKAPRCGRRGYPAPKPPSGCVEGPGDFGGRVLSGTSRPDSSKSGHYFLGQRLRAKPRPGG